MRIAVAVLLVAACSAAWAAEESESALLLKWMDARAQSLLGARAANIKTIRTKEQARARQAEVRETVLKLLGGLPDDNPPLDPHVTGKLEQLDYTIEKVYFTSLPGVYVTANLYLPRTPGRHPGVLYSLGHWDTGKPAAQTIASNLARKGFVVLAYDPIGQGERQQAFDIRTGNSLLGGSTEQHFALGAQSILQGQSFARYMIHDSQRALDYLISRPEVDASRIGASGCSGGGTQTTFVAALDPRIKVAAPACYMNSFQILFSGSIGDSEQSIPNFLAAGLDQTDLVELFAPKPWLISSTEKDFFTPAGAKIVYDEAQSWYNLFGAEDGVKWVVGPGGHGTPLKVREAIYGWMIRWLTDGKGDPTEKPTHLYSDPELLVTPKGQAALLPGAKDLYSYVATHYSFDQRVSVARKPQEEAPQVLNTSTKDGVEITELRLPVDPGLTIPATLRVPSGAKSAPAVLLVQHSAARHEQAAQLTKKGAVVLQLWPRGLPSEFGSPTRLSGDWITSTRALLLGRNLAEDRARDIQIAAAYLAKRPEVDKTNVSATASDVAGLWLLLAAAQPMFRQIWLDRTPYSLAAALQSPVLRDGYEALLPGGTRAGDVPDRRNAAQSRILWTDPTDWMRNIVPNLGAEYTYRAFDDTDDRFWQVLLKP